jgi:hypothetical protein
MIGIPFLYICPDIDIFFCYYERKQQINDHRGQLLKVYFENPVTENMGIQLP